MNEPKSGLPGASRLQSNRTPLHQRVPTRDENGAPLGDLMMLIPGLRNRSGADFDRRLAILQELLGEHRDVVFADLNAPLNLLWISVRARHGVISDVAAEIRLRIPEARLVGHTATAKQVTQPSHRSTTKNRESRQARISATNPANTD